MEFKLIEAVQMFPCLYGKSKQEYRNKLKNEKSWDSVSEATGATVEQCQTRWRSLRDRYVRETASAKPKSGAGAEDKRKWCYLDAMSFLQKHVAPRRAISNLQWGSSEQETFVEEVEDESSFSFDMSGMVSNGYSDDYANNCSNEEETPNKSKKRKTIEKSHEKFDMLCSAVNDFIVAKSESCERSRNSDFWKVLDSYLLKQSEKNQERLKIKILNLVFKT